MLRDDKYFRVGFMSDILGSKKHSHNGCAFLVWSNEMFTVYAIYSKCIDKIYIGQTSDLEARLRSHREFNKGFTARADDWE